MPKAIRIDLKGSSRVIEEKTYIDGPLVRNVEEEQIITVYSIGF